MIITILSEPRSGSTNLTTWLKKSLPDYVVVGEPYNVNSFDYITNIHFNTDWIDLKKNNIINEKFYPIYGNFNQLTDISDKVICLYREDTIKQIESYISAKVSGNWGDPYYSNKYILNKTDTVYLDHKTYFETLKTEFKNFINKNGYKSFTYEDLYYRNKINEFKEYLNLDISQPFPYGKKYRIDLNVERLI